MARGLLRKKNWLELVEAFFACRFGQQHGWLLSKMLDRVDQFTADIAEVDERIGDQIAPVASAVAQLTQIPGISGHHRPNHHR